MSLWAYGKFWLGIAEALPNKSEIYSLLSGHQHVFKVSKKFEMKTMKGYHDLYLKWKILLSADVFGKTRNRYLESYGLCHTHYLRAPALSWDAILTIIKAKRNQAYLRHIFYISKR